MPQREFEIYKSPLTKTLKNIRTGEFLRLLALCLGQGSVVVLVTTIIIIISFIIIISTGL